VDLLSYLLRLGVSKLREAAKRGNLLAVAITGQARRSPHWRAVEKAWLAKHGHCAACGNNEQLQVHHVLPFHSHPELELADGTGRYCLARDPKNPRLFRENLVTLCMNRGFECHLAIGHGGDFRRDNPRVLDDAAELRRYPARRPLIWARSRAESLAGE
jgi:5-methylcytosine-specific restriction protein A